MPQRRLTTCEAVIMQARAFRSLKTFIAQVLYKHDQTVTEWLIIGIVIESGKNGIRVSELANTLGVVMPVITNLIHKSVAANLLERISDSNDKRAKRIVATKHGINKAAEIESELRCGSEHWLGELEPGKLEGYFEVITAMADDEFLSTELKMVELVET